MTKAQAYMLIGAIIYMVASIEEGFSSLIFWIMGSALFIAGIFCNERNDE